MPAGSKLLGRRLPDLLRAAVPQGKPREHRRHLLRSRQGAYRQDELLQRKLLLNLLTEHPVWVR